MFLNISENDLGISKITALFVQTRDADVVGLVYHLLLESPKALILKFQNIPQTLKE